LHKIHKLSFQFLPCDAVIALYAYGTVSISLSVTSLIKMAKVSATQSAPHDSLGSVVVCCHRSWWNSNVVTLNWVSSTIGSIG